MSIYYYNLSYNPASDAKACDDELAAFKTSITNCEADISRLRATVASCSDLDIAAAAAKQFQDSVGHLKNLNSVLPRMEARHAEIRAFMETEKYKQTAERIAAEKERIAAENRVARELVNGVLAAVSDESKKALIGKRYRFPDTDAFGIPILVEPAEDYAPGTLVGFTTPGERSDNASRFTVGMVLKNLGGKSARTSDDYLVVYGVEACATTVIYKPDLALYNGSE